MKSWDLKVVLYICYLYKRQVNKPVKETKEQPTNPSLLLFSSLHQRPTTTNVFPPSYLPAYPVNPDQLAKHHWLTNKLSDEPTKQESIQLTGQPKPVRQISQTNNNKQLVWHVLLNQAIKGTSNQYYPPTETDEHAGDHTVVNLTWAVYASSWNTSMNILRSVQKLVSSYSCITVSCTKVGEILNRTR